MSRTSMPSIADVAQPMLRLAGNISGLTLRTVATGAERKVPAPAGAKLGGFSFSPDGRRFTFTNTRDNGIDLYVGDVSTAQARLVRGAALNGLTGWCDWLDDSTALLCGFVPRSRGAAPGPPAVPPGPNIQENYGKAGPQWTYQDLLTSAHDEDLFEHYMQTQLAFVDAASGRRTAVGQPGTINGASVSPDGQYLLVQRIKRPFSRLLTWPSFPLDVEIWSRTGAKVRTVADVPMADTVPINGVITGARSYEWIPSEPASVLWVEALDQGDLRNRVPHRDRVVT